MVPPLVSAIIINYNGKDLLKTCIDSLIQSSYENLEIVVVDCASKDDSIKLLKENYHQVKIVDLKKDKGTADAVNVGVLRSRGDLILVLNNDVMVPFSMIEILVKNSEKFGVNTVLNPIELTWAGKFRLAGYPHWLGKIFSLFLRNDGDEPFYPSTSCCFAARELMLKVPMNSNFFMYEDTEWGWRLRLKGSRIKLVPNCFYLHKFEGTSLHHSKRQAFLLGKARISTYYICLSRSHFYFFAPLIFSHFIWAAIPYIKQREFSCISAMISGIGSFLKNLKVFEADRKTLQSTRTMSDVDLIRFMSRSSRFDKKIKNKFRNFSYNALADRDW